MSEGEILIEVNNVSKKFCRSLKLSLAYGVADMVKALNPLPQSSPSQTSGDSGNTQLPKLRKNEFWAVKNVSFQVRRGECLALMGHNGAGKSTLLKILNNLIKPDTGQITMRGRVCALIELNAGFNPILTGRENVYTFGTLLGLSKKEIDKKFNDIVEFSEIGDFIDTPVQNYSSGM